MLNIFQKLRKRTAGEGQFKKYLIYAAGEILLIVVGILIALKINTINENNKLMSTEHRYLERIQIDLAKDTIYYNDRLARAKQYIEKNRQALKEAYNIQETKEEFTSLLDMQTWESEQLTVHDATYYELLNAGRLDIFRNDDVKIMIINYYRNCEAIEKHVEEFNDFTVQLLLIAVDKGINNKYQSKNKNIFTEPKMFDPEDWAYINDSTSDKFKALELAVLSYMQKHEVFVLHFNQLKSQSIELINKINEVI